MSRDLKASDLLAEAIEEYWKACTNMIEYRLRQLPGDKEDCKANELNDTAAKETSDNKKEVDSDNKVHDDDFVDEEIILEPDNDFNSAFRPQDQAHASFSYRAAIDSVDEEDPCLMAPMKCSQEIQVDCNTNDLNDTAAKETSDNEKKVESDDELYDDDFVEEDIFLKPDNDFNSAFCPHYQAHTSSSYRPAIDAEELPIDNLVVLHPSKQRPRPQIPQHFNQILNNLNSQGDSQSTENFEFRNFGNNSDNINVAVNTTFLRDTKFVTLILIINILLMLKIIVWDSFFSVP